ncbi:MAG: hypothetical protein QMD80_08560, partial [archaeon]|nr:hypothetical protein [archaeon]
MKKRGPRRKEVIAEQIVEFIQRCLFVKWSIMLLRFFVSGETIRRRLRESGHTLVRSLNKNKKHFTLKSLIQANMDRNGIWECEGVVFSIYEEAKPTILNLINKSKAGWTELELRDYLKIIAKGVLIEMYREGLISRAKFGHHYVYFSKDAEKRKKQIILRHGKEPQCG